MRPVFPLRALTRVALTIALFAGTLTAREEKKAAASRPKPNLQIDGTPIDARDAVAAVLAPLVAEGTLRANGRRPAAAVLTHPGCIPAPAHSASDSFSPFHSPVFAGWSDRSLMVCLKPFQSTRAS